MHRRGSSDMTRPPAASPRHRPCRRRCSDKDVARVGALRQDSDAFPLVPSFPGYLLDPDSFPCSFPDRSTPAPTPTHDFEFDFDFHPTHDFEFGLWNVTDNAELGPPGLATVFIRQSIVN